MLGLCSECADESERRISALYGERVITRVCGVWQLVLSSCECQTFIIIIRHHNFILTALATGLCLEGQREHWHARQWVINVVDAEVDRISYTQGNYRCLIFGKRALYVYQGTKWQTRILHVICFDLLLEHHCDKIMIFFFFFF